MKNSKFLAHDDVQGVKENHEKVRASMNAEQRALAEEGDRAFDEMNKDIFDFDSEARIRNSGFKQSEAEELAKIVKTKQVGQVFQYGSKFMVLTPFKTVVPAQLYVNTIQESLLVTTDALQTFTSASFFGLIRLAFKRLITKGDRNG